MSDPTEGFTDAEMREFHANCRRFGWDPNETNQRHLAAGFVKDLPPRSWLTSPEAERARRAREAWLLVRIGDWELYGWRLFAAFMVWSFALGVGRGVMGTWLG